MSKSTQHVAGAIVVGAVLIGLAACGSQTTKANQPNLDAGQTGYVDRTAALTIAGPDGFSNMTAKCVVHNGVYVAYHGDNPYASIFVVPNDPNCATGVYVDPNAHKE